jgi:hypothetical protein
MLDALHGETLLEGFVVGKRYLLMDRDTKFYEGFRNTLRQAGVHAAMN